MQAASKICIVDPRPGDYAALLGAYPATELRWQFVGSGREALQTAISGGVDLWVVNAQLPDMSGADLCEMLRSRDRQATVYLVTDAYCLEDERRGWISGAALFRPKPVEASWFEHIAARAPATASAG